MEMLEAEPINTQLPRCIVLLSGKRKCGKDYLADKILAGLSGRTGCIARLSGPLKAEYARMHGLDLEELLSSGPYKEVFRKDMVRWSEELRLADPGYFCRLACPPLTTETTGSPSCPTPDKPACPPLTTETTGSPGCPTPDKPACPPLTTETTRSPGCPTPDKPAFPPLTTETTGNPSCPTPDKPAPAGSVWIVSDVRRKSDMTWFDITFGNRGKCPGSVRLIKIRVEATVETRQHRGWVFEEGVDDAETECGLDDYGGWDAVMENNDSVQGGMVVDFVLSLVMG